VSFFSQYFRGDSYFFDGEFSLEEPAPDYFHNIHRMANRLSPSLDGQSVLAAVEMHHNSSRIRHQRLFADKHGVWRNLATRSLHQGPAFPSFWSLSRSLLCVFCLFCL